MPTAPSMLDARPPRHRNIAWLWFAYTGFLFIEPFFDPNPMVWIGTFLALAVFAVIFSLYTRCDENEASSRRYWLIAATFALALVTFLFNGGASCLFIYVAAFITYTVSSIRRIVLLFFGECLLILCEALLFHHPFHLPYIPYGFHTSFSNALVAVFLVIIIGGANIFFAEQKRFNDLQLRAARELRDAQEQNLALAAVAERERIARDLHDVLGHTLSVITLKAELAGRLVERDPARAIAEIAEVEGLARTSLSEVREAITGYRSQGLAAEIEAARRTLDAAGVTLILEQHELQANVGLSAQEETVLALALREAVTNIVRHARATTCTLRFVSPAETALRYLIIEDDGSVPAPPREGNGLRGMRARIESIGGKLTLETGGGTRLLIALPQVAA